MPVPIGSASRTLPVSAFRITIVAGLWQEAKRMWFFASKRQPAGSAALAVESISGGYFERLGVHRGDLVLIFQVDLHVALAVGDGLFRRAAQVERADDRAVLGVDDGGVGRAVAEYPDALVERDRRECRPGRPARRWS